MILLHLLLGSFLIPNSIADVGVFVFHVHRGDSGSEYRKSFDEVLVMSHAADNRECAINISTLLCSPDHQVAETSEFRLFPFHFSEYAEKRVEDLAFGLGKSLEVLHPYYLPLGGSTPFMISTVNRTVYGMQPEISGQMRDLFLSALHRSGFHTIEQNTISEFKNSNPNLIIIASTPLTRSKPDWMHKIGLTHVRLNPTLDIYRCKEHWTDEKCVRIKTQCIGKSFC